MGKGFRPGASMRLNVERNSQMASSSSGAAVTGRMMREGSRRSKLYAHVHSSRTHCEASAASERITTTTGRTFSSRSMVSTS